MLKTIRIFGKERKSKDGEKKFTEYSYTKDGVKFYKVKFTKDCMTTPKDVGYFKLEINSEDVSIAKGKTHENFTENDTLWIKDVVRCTKDVEADTELAEKRRKAVEEAL